MFRGLVLSAVVLAALVGLTRAADPSPLAGSWKLAVPNGKDEVILILSFAEKDGKWEGSFGGSFPKLVESPKFKSLKVNGDVLQFALEVKGQEFVSFDGQRAKDGKKMEGSISVAGSRLMLTELYPTKLKKLDDPIDYLRELAGQAEGPLLFEAAGEVVNEAAAKKIPADELRGILDRVNKAAAGYGPRWEREMTIRLAGALAGQDGFADLAVAQAKRAERLLSDDDDLGSRMAVLDLLVKALTKANKAAEAKPYQAQVAKLEARDYAEYAKTMPFKPVPFAGRKVMSDRTAVVEVFTGAECPPCVAVDLAFDGLLKTYQPADVVHLQYHLHVPRPDPLASPDAMKRAEEYYGQQVDGTPTVLINGKLGAPGGGSSAAAEKKYGAFCTQINEALEKPAGAKIGLTVAKGDKGYTAKATVSDLDAPGEKTMLRFALAEERVRYTGGNGLRYHHMVVRAMPGGFKGFPLTRKTAEQSVSFDPDELRAALTKYLDGIDFARSELPLALKNLKLVAFVQNDATQEIVQAVQVDVGGR
jgi:hypothetical protein